MNTEPTAAAPPAKPAAEVGTPVAGVPAETNEKFVDYPPQKLPKVKKPQPEEVLKALYPLAATPKEGRPPLSGVYLDEENGSTVAVATNGKRLVMLPYSGSKPAGKIYATGKDKKTAEGKEIELQYPNWKVVVPEVGPLSVPISEDALSKIEQAAKENKSKKGTLVDRVFVRVSLPKGDSVLVDPEDLHDVVKALRTAGETDFRLNITDEMSTLVVTTDTLLAKGVLMPARAKDYQKYLSLGSATMTPAPTKEFGSSNTVVTKETKDAAVKSLRKKIGGQTNVGLDPSILKDAIAIGAFYLEGGARSFAEFSASRPTRRSLRQCAAKKPRRPRSARRNENKAQATDGA